jgi:molecular chaperone DnaK (HSP70)
VSEPSKAIAGCVGIDLGTTHTALAEAHWNAKKAQVNGIAIEQVTAPGAVQALPLLPSFVYFSHESEPPLALRWDATRRFCVGEYARERAGDAPGRVVSSAKSWLSHVGIDRRSALLPMSAPNDVERISPVEASYRILDHLCESYRAEERPFGDLTEQQVILAVPASFDAAARDLTLEAALAAGLENVYLLEEPQAALYAWIEATGDDFRKHLHVDDVVLVVDVGGGTTDFSAILVQEKEGNFELSRVAVGDHILLGGDNMDLALAYALKAKLEKEGAPIEQADLLALWHAARRAKEEMLSRPELEAVPVAIAGRGSQLLGHARRTDLTRAEVQSLLLDGFFPNVAVTARPAVRTRAALTQLGLPYASDAGITRHLAEFLCRQAGAVPLADGTQPSFLRPTALLFNGGVFKSELFRRRIIDNLSQWLSEVGAEAPRVLPGENLDLAVARGAAYYGAVRSGRGVRIRGGTARAYYVGIESPMPAVPGMEPPLVALCVAPFGIDEGTACDLPDQVLGAVVGQPVTFRFFSSTVRRADTPGTVIDPIPPQEIDEIAPIEIVLPADNRRPGEVVAVRLQASVTAVGSLLIEAVPLDPVVPNERWKVELNVRGEGT